MNFEAIGTADDSNIHPNDPNPDPEPTCASELADIFVDVYVGHAFCAEIGWVADRGIANGWRDDTFRPDWLVNRQAVAAFLYRLTGESDGQVTDPGFDDIDEEHPFYREIAWLAEQDITLGYSDGSFRSGEEVTRQAMAAFCTGSP